MKIASKLIVSFLTITLLVSLVGFIGYNSTSKIRSEFNIVVEQMLPMSLELQELKYAVIRISKSTAEIALFYHEIQQSKLNNELAAATEYTAELDAETLELKDEALLAFNLTLKNYADIVQQFYPDEQDSLTLIRLNAIEFKSTVKKVIELKENGLSGEAALEIQKLLKNSEKELLIAIEDALEHIQEKSWLHEIEVSNTINNAITLLLVASFLAVLFSISLGGLIAKSLSRPIIVLKNAAQSLGRGNLDIRVKNNSKDEIGVLARAFNDMAQALNSSTVSKEYFENILESMADMLLVLNPEGLIIQTNNALEQRLGFTRDQLNNQKIAAVVDDQGFLERINNLTLNSDNINAYESSYRTSMGQCFDVQISARPLKSSNGKLAGIVLLAQDITERKANEERLSFLANYDALTGLPNRTLFTQQLEQILARLEWNGRKAGVIFCDLDRFKLINDTLGHEAGDQVLKITAQRLLSCVREGDIVARQSGDEFVIILNDVADDLDIPLIANNIVQKLASPIQLKRHELYVTVSAGIAIAPQDGTDSGTLLRNADIAMFCAKRGGKNNWMLYSPTMHYSSGARLEQESKLRHAIEREELRVYYQPQIEAKSGRVIGSEALVRWEHPEKGILEPIEFLPLAIETGLISKIDEWIMRTACAQNKVWCQQGLDVIKIAVNVSDRLFNSQNLLELVKDILKETELPADALELELTEAIVMKTPMHTGIILSELKAMGVTLAIDDFGTGYSSLGHLKRLPIDKVKIDRSFIIDIINDPHDAAITEAIIALSHKMNMRVLAEGVEDDSQRQFLINQGCDEIQGYLFGRPLPADEFQLLLSPLTRNIEESAPN